MASSEPPTSAGLSLEAALALGTMKSGERSEAAPGTRPVIPSIGDDLLGEREEEATRAIGSAELRDALAEAGRAAHPADGEGPTLTRSPADGEGPTLIRSPADGDGPTLVRVPADAEAPAPTPADREGPTLARASPRAPAPPPSLVDDDVPVHEGTAMLPRSMLLRGVPQAALGPSAGDESSGVDVVVGAALPSEAPLEPETDSSPPPVRDGWRLRAVVFVVSFLVFSGGALLLVWHLYYR